VLPSITYTGDRDSNKGSLALLKLYLKVLLS
jgi:hypothetical protein